MAERVCPVWVGYLLASPLRKLIQNPNTILKPYLKSDMTALDLGSAMGFFSLPMAEMVGPKGRVICIDVQQRMLDKLGERAQKAKVADRIIPHLVTTENLGLENYRGQVDFALAMAVLHEIPDLKKTLEWLSTLMKPGGQLLVAEPKGHVTKEGFIATEDLLTGAGFTVIDRPEIKRSAGLALLLQKN